MVARHESLEALGFSPFFQAQLDALDGGREPARIAIASNNQTDNLIRDAFGHRVLTVYGTSGSAGTLLSLDDLFGGRDEVPQPVDSTPARCTGGR